MGFTKPEVPCQIFTDDDLIEIFKELDRRMRLNFTRDIIRDVAKENGIEIFGAEAEPIPDEAPF